MSETRLGRVIATTGGEASASPPVGVSRLGRQLVAGRRGLAVTLPVLGAAWIEPLGPIAYAEVHSELFRAMAELGLPFEDAHVLTYELARARLTLPRAVRDPDNHAIAFGTVEEWGAIDNGVVEEAWSAYGDVRERLNPVEALTDREFATIRAALKKKDATILRSFGVARLAHFMLTTADLPSISVEANSSSTPSSLDG